MASVSSFISNLKRQPMKVKIQSVVAVVVVSLAAYLFYSGTDAAMGEDVRFGEVAELTPVVDNSHSSEANVTIAAPKFKEPERIVIPQFNIVVELAKLIENVRNKPEALLDIQMAAGQKALENRAKLAELSAQEAKAILEYRQAEAALTDLNSGVVSTKPIPTDEDINPLKANSLLQVNYNTADFKLKNVRPTFAGLEGLIDYKGRYYKAVVGEEVVPKVVVVSLNERMVVLSAPTIGKFTIPFEL